MATTERTWRPSPAQERFLRCPAFEVVYGGGKGSGKTDGLLAAAARLTNEPRYRALLLRREWKQAERTLQARAKQLYPGLGARWVASRHAWVFPSGAEVEINGCDNPDDVERYFGTPELSFLAIDQLEHFTRDMYLALLSCVRSAAGFPLRVRATANPGGVGHDWLIERFGPWVQKPEGDPWHDAEYLSVYASSGEILWFRTTSGEDGEEELCERDAHEPLCAEERERAAIERNEVREDPPCAPGAPCVLHAPRSRAYFHTTVLDNPYLRGTRYEAILHGLDPVSRARFLGGNWMVRAKPGIYFSRSTIPVVQALNAPVVARVRYFDRAATDAKQAKANGAKAAWTAGVRMVLLASGVFVVEHVARGQWDPGGVDQAILTTARSDPFGTVVALERDPGQAGKSQAYYDSRMLAGIEFVLPPPKGDKVTRMRPFSAQARVGNVALLQGSWTEAYLRELEGCPGGLWDQVDSSSGAMMLLLQLEEQARAHRKAVAGNGRPSGRMDRHALGPLRSGLR